MAKRADMVISPEGEEWLTCDVCGWWDRKLWLVGSPLTPEERLSVHRWARHNMALPWDSPPTSLILGDEGRIESKQKPPKKSDQPPVDPADEP